MHYVHEAYSMSQKINKRYDLFYSEGPQVIARFHAFIMTTMCAFHVAHMLHLHFRLLRSFT